MTNSTSRPRRSISALGSAIAIITLAIGVPILLAKLAGWPLPTVLPTPDQLHTALSRPIPDTAIINTIAVLAWTGWLMFIWCYHNWPIPWIFR